MRLFAFAAVLLLIVPMSLAFAQQNQVAISAQTIVRDSNGGLVAYLNIHKIGYVSYGLLNKFLDEEFDPKSDQVISENGHNIQLIRRFVEYHTDSDNVISDLTLNTTVDGRPSTLVRPIHDGIPVRAGDTITMIWTFARMVS